MRDATRVVHAGARPPASGEPLRAGPVFASTFVSAGDPAGGGVAYARDGNPTWTDYEAALAELEGGPCLVFASGMAAIAAVLLGTTQAGDVVVLPSDGYFTVRALAAGPLAAQGVCVRSAPTAAGAQGALLDGCTLLWIESPSNPGLDVCDLAALVEAAHAAGARVAVDNTTATPLGQRPLALGADFVVASDTKAMSGHSDLLLGHVAVRDPTALGPVRDWRRLVGAIPGPMETWLAHRSLATLDVRLQRQCDTAGRLAPALLAHPAVRVVRWPGLPDDPSYALAQRQMQLPGFLIGLTLADAPTADAFLAGCDLVLPTTSFGGVHTTAERRGRWGADEVHPGFVRLSVGLEDAEDLLADLMSALDALPP